MRRSLFQFVRSSSGFLPLLCLLVVLTAAQGWSASVTLDNFILITYPATEAEYDEDTGEVSFPAEPESYVWARGEFGTKGSMNPGAAFVGQSGNQFDEHFRSYFGFDLRGLAGMQVQSATLRLYLKDFYPETGNPSTINFSIHETSVHPTDILKTVNDLDVLSIYEDLGQTPGGGRLNVENASLSRGDEGTVVELVLSAQALGLINSSILSPLINARFFGVGVTLDAITQVTEPFYQEGLRFALGNEPFPNQLILTYVPIPDSGATLGLLALGGVLVALLRGRNRY